MTTVSKFDLSTERLFLRPLTDNDKEDVRRSIFSKPDCMRTLMGDGSTKEKQIRLVNEWYHEYGNTWDELGYGLWGVYRRTKQSDLPSGLLGIIWIERPNDDEGRVEINYAVNPTAWGKGIAYEAGARVLDFIFETTATPSVDARIFEDVNPASIRLIKKWGGCFVERRSAVDYVGLDWLRRTNDYDLWLIQRANRAMLSNRIRDACIRTGQLIAEGVLKDRPAREAVHRALHANPNYELTPEVIEKIEHFLSIGLSSPGMSLYRIDRHIWMESERH